MSPQSRFDIPQFHVLQIILKRYRKTHCHFCFKQLPPSPIPCSACAIPIYCDESCRHGSCGELSQDVEGRRWRGEHNHECGGASWSAVLPPDAVLALRLLSQSQSNEKLKIHVSVYLLVLNSRLCISYFLAFKGYFTLELKGSDHGNLKTLIGGKCLDYPTSLYLY